MVIKYSKMYSQTHHILKQKNRNLMAMIHQLVIPTLFIFLSAADTKWTELLQSIYILTKKRRNNS